MNAKGKALVWAILVRESVCWAFLFLGFWLRFFKEKSGNFQFKIFTLVMGEKWSAW